MWLIRLSWFLNNNNLTVIQSEAKNLGNIHVDVLVYVTEILSFSICILALHNKNVKFPIFSP